MFIVLRTIKPENGFLNRRRQRKRLGKSEPFSCSTENGLPFFILDILCEKNGISRMEIEEKCGRYVSRIVAPRNILLPDNGRIKRFTPGVSNGMFMFNTALGTIENAHLRPDEICITVIDRNAGMSGEIHRLLPYASSVRTVTSRPERYALPCRQIYDEFGASVMVRPVYQPVGKKEIIICCDGATTEAMQKSAVFSFKRGIYGNLRFYSCGIELSEKHKIIIPDSIDTVDFASAVTELCGSTEYKFSRFSHTETNCTDCIDSSASKCLDCYISRRAKNQ